ncbi:TRAP transporter substrate-binding protein [Alloalcanivorax xenomutans]|jgi:TRAP-type transport system periplasmic protein|uniref:TRAP transporter substrate-binding protein n=1 Tax=Alloalcanivorax xenomutans TaxID=1094342 RepID=UPI0004BC4418|nr:TRAP transporter substrate-binding protein DctP [Alloalcanivorax xenomutans]SOC09002.1 TRAP-type C4-dicarboxylate transport system substrate-binding protein [Alloalcanivorax xenomutans]|tara:strand:- start:3065 stop:4102 length:1038 start_codon:yes stop_codon:yes gene_type:complete
MKITTSILRKQLPFWGLMLTLLSTPLAQARDMTLADSFPLDHYLSREGTVYWMRRVTELTGGDLSFQHYPAEQIAKASEIMRRVQDGVVDVGYVGIGYVSDRMPLNGATMLPGVVRDSRRASLAYWSELQDPDSVYRKEFDKNGLVPVFAVLLPPYQVVLNRQAIDSPGDFKGLNLRSSGSLDLAVQALGASPVSMAAPDIYLALQRGTLDGTLLPVTSITPYRVDEVTSSVSTNGAFGSFAITVAMNASRYEALSDAQKHAIRQAGDETVRHLSEYEAEQVDQLLTHFKNEDIDVYAFSDATLKTIEQRLDGVREQWVARMEKRGLDGRKALQSMEHALEQNRR